MPTRDEIQREIGSLKSTGQDFVRRNYLKNLFELTGRDTLIYFSGYGTPRPYTVPSAAIIVTTEDIQGFMSSLHNLKGDTLDLVLHSPGGSLEAADQLVQYLRAKYKHIRVLVPQSAMSAATMIACAADEIVMGKHSAIGPIDPQMSVAGQGSIPAHTILKEFEQAKEQVKNDPKLAAVWAPRLTAIPLGFLNLCEQTISLAQLKVKTWLAQYMFKGSNDAKAEEIAAWLANFDEHRTHGRPIGLDLAREKGLVVTALEDDQALQEAVLSVFHAAMVTFQSTNCMKITENHLGKGSYVVYSGPINPK